MEDGAHQMSCEFSIPTNVASSCSEHIKFWTIQKASLLANLKKNIQMLQNTVFPKPQQQFAKKAKKTECDLSINKK